MHARSGAPNQLSDALTIKKLSQDQGDVMQPHGTVSTRVNSNYTSEQLSDLLTCCKVNFLTCEMESREQ
jgi:hypothetical protein